MSFRHTFGQITPFCPPPASIFQYFATKIHYHFCPVQSDVHQDSGGNWDFLEEKTADIHGYFQFYPRENWDDDIADADH